MTKNDYITAETVPDFGALRSEAAQLLQPQLHFAAHYVKNKNLVAIESKKNAAGRLYNLPVQ